MSTFPNPPLIVGPAPADGQSATYDATTNTWVASGPYAPPQSFSLCYVAAPAALGSSAQLAFAGPQENGTDVTLTDTHTFTIHTEGMYSVLIDPVVTQLAASDGLVTIFLSLTTDDSNSFANQGNNQLAFPIRPTAGTGAALSIEIPFTTAPFHCLPGDTIKFLASAVMAAGTATADAGTCAAVVRVS